MAAVIVHGWRNLTRARVLEQFIQDTQLLEQQQCHKGILHTILSNHTHACRILRHVRLENLVNRHLVLVLDLKILQRLEVTVDGETRTFQATDVAISNCGILARGLNPNGPDVRADDGQIDVCILCMKTPLEYPWYYFLKHIAPQYDNKVMHALVARKRVTVRSDAPISVQADGDIIGATPVDVDVLPAALTVLVPEAG